MRPGVGTGGKPEAFETGVPAGRGLGFRQVVPAAPFQAGLVPSCGSVF